MIMSGRLENGKVKRAFLIGLTLKLELGNLCLLLKLIMKNMNSLAGTFVVYVVV